MSRYLIPARDEPEYWTEERCFIREILNDPKVPQVSLAEARVEPGVTTALHKVSVAEWYLIRQGEGLMEIAGEAPFEVVAGNTVCIPPDTPQRITNTGRIDLRFDCICMPRFTPAVYETVARPR